MEYLIYKVHVFDIGMKEFFKMDAIETVLQFVAGKIDTATFEHALYTNPKLEELLRDPSVNWHGSYVAAIAVDLYDYLIMLDYRCSADNVNAVGALELFLQKKGIVYSKDDKHSELFCLMLETQPKYLDLDSAFFEQYILPTDRNIPKSELKKLIRKNCNKYFKYQVRPPKWIQNPAWVIKNDKPLLFIGQLELNIEFFHDKGVVYIFLDTESGKIETVKQFY